MADISHTLLYLPSVQAQVLTLNTELTPPPAFPPSNIAFPPPNRRGEYIEMKYLTDSRTTLLYDIPLAEVVTDFFDELKSRSKGYASMEYKITGVEGWKVWGGDGS